MIFVLVLVYVLNQQLVFERPGYKTMEECLVAGKAKVAELELNPAFDGGLLAHCVPLPGKEIKSS